MTDPSGTPDSISKNKLKIWLRAAVYESLSYIRDEYQWTLRWCGVGSVDVPAPSYAMCCGKSSTSNWNDYYGEGVTTVSLKGCEFTGSETPYVFTSLSDTSGGKSARALGVNSIYGPSNDAFTVYLKMLPGYSSMGNQGYNQANFQLNWCAFQPRTNQGFAGYPCE